MPEHIYTLHLEPYDDVVSVRDRLAFVKAPAVLLVWPERGTVLRRKLDLLLIQRQARRLHIQIALVTGDLDVMDAAHELNISVFPDEQTAAQHRWKRPRNKVFISPRDAAQEAEVVDHVLRQRQPLSPAARRRRQFGRWMVFAALLATVGIGFLVAAPSATVTITPASRQVYETITIVAAPDQTDIDVQNFRMPAAVVSLQATSRVTVPSSGTETAGTSLAQGLVTFTNLSDFPVVVPLGTVVSTGGTYPVRFETLIETTLPSGDAAAIQVPVQALPSYAGAAGNVDPGAISRVESEIADLVVVTNPNATYGGAVQELSVVTAQDHERLLVLGQQQVLQNARDILLHQLQGEQFLVPGSLAIIDQRPEWIIYSHLIGDTTESVSLDLRAVVQAVVVDERQAQQVAYAGLAPYLQPGMEIAPEALRFSRGDIVEIRPDGQVTFLMIVSGSIAVSIDEEYVLKRVTGVSVSEARRRLDRELLLDPNRPPQINTWPGWYHRMPFLPVRISVDVRTP